MKHRYKTLGLVAATTLALGTGVHAASITVQTFSPAAFAGFGNGNTVLEDFETRSDLSATFESDGTNTGKTNGAGETFGELAVGASLSSKVGTFTGLASAPGTGSTCTGLSVGNNICTNIALQFEPPLNSQGNIVPDDGQWSINAADTVGISWSAFLPGGKEFTSLFFAIRDATDQGAKLTITAGGEFVEFEGLSNDNKQIVFVDFGGAVSSALITMENDRVNDSFTIDGASITPVPLPAAGWLMIAGLGGLAALRRRKRAA